MIVHVKNGRLAQLRIWSRATSETLPNIVKTHVFVALVYLLYSKGQPSIGSNFKDDHVRSSKSFVIMSAHGFVLLHQPPAAPRAGLWTGPFSDDCEKWKLIGHVINFSCFSFLSSLACRCPPQWREGPNGGKNTRRTCPTALVASARTLRALLPVAPLKKPTDLHLEGTPLGSAFSFSTLGASELQRTTTQSFPEMLDKIVECCSSCVREAEGSVFCQRLVPVLGLSK